MKLLPISILLFGLALSGCHTAAPKAGTAESKVDSRLAGGGFADSNSNSGPGEPQKGFDQQPLGAQNR
jgi:hypothetical protein